jgi:hypothetical protein
MDTSTSHRINSAKRKMLQGEPAIGTACGTGSPLIAEMLSHAGFDFILVDLQHGAWTDETVAHAFRARCHAYELSKFGDLVPWWLLLRRFHSAGSAFERQPWHR